MQEVRRALDTRHGLAGLRAVRGAMDPLQQKAPLQAMRTASV